MFASALEGLNYWTTGRYQVKATLIAAFLTFNPSDTPKCRPSKFLAFVTVRVFRSRVFKYEN